MKLEDQFDQNVKRRRRLFPHRGTRLTGKACRRLRHRINEMKKLMAKLDKAEERVIVAGIMRVAQANFSSYISDPNGDMPRCKNMLGTWNCERCGRDVRGTKDACPTSLPEQRWGMFTK